MARRRLLLVAAVVLALLGALLVLLYVRGADARARARFDLQPVLVVTTTVPAGTPLSSVATSVALADVPEAQVLPGALTDVAEAGTAVTLTTLYPGEQVIADKLGSTADLSSASLQIPDDGELAISVNLTDPARVAGFVEPGSEVAVLVTVEADGTQEPYSRVLLPRVGVIAVGSTTPTTTTTTTTSSDGTEETTEQLPRTLITLSLDQREAQRVLLAQQQGELAFALLTDQSRVSGGQAVTPSNLFGRG
ncbi:Flp pilus assembly protein CpaB [Nocardioides bruguierae]|uniref:Flp pilus assembly protein CpaB n=1 Tax=Nocardioides bruguierae TaxID=2945102 RepID=A0A9X2DA83_9ACTN|nr:Flp pilus assembly protein CpaB [Nocardioides bruguierae]MCL8027035.1 Flp pilus assembly protein CpaB [Nocardioides bruguierae]MCM0621662.1 Flp pilus assembly protein CpaB [Nocardioides bruguierae]